MNAGLAKMHAMNAALTPAERKARSAAAAAASKAATAARAAAAAVAPSPIPPVAPSTPIAAPAAPTPPLPGRMWTVTLVIKQEHGLGLWRCDVSAPTMRKASKGARRAFTGVGTITATAACVDKHMIALPPIK